MGPAHAVTATAAYDHSCGDAPSAAHGKWARTTIQASLTGRLTRLMRAGSLSLAGSCGSARLKASPTVVSGAALLASRHALCLCRYTDYAGSKFLTRLSFFDQRVQTRTGTDTGSCHEQTRHSKGHY